MIYRATDPLPNAMTVPLPSFGLTEEPDTCAVCGAEEYDCKDTRYGLLCSSCMRPCDWCGDCMLAEEGNVHKACADSEEYKEDLAERRREHGYDDYVSGLIDEWRETGERPAIRPMRRRR